MRYFVGLSLWLFMACAHSALITIDFEEFADGPINPPSGDMISKGFTFDYLDQGGNGIPVVSAAGSPNGTQGYANCPSCYAVEQIDVFSSSNYVFALNSMDVAGVGSIDPAYDFIITGFVAGGGTVSFSALGVSTLQTLSFDSSWSSLESFRIEIDNTNGGNAFASFIDNVVVEAVPVPAAAWLFGSALAGLGWLKRKQTV
jgi:hypothetical protein